MQGSWGLVGETLESISHILFLFIQTEMKKKMKKLSVTLFNLAGNLSDERWEPWKLSDSWLGPLSYFPAETRWVIQGNTEGIKSNITFFTLKILSLGYPQKFNNLSIQEIA